MASKHKLQLEMDTVEQGYDSSPKNIPQSPYSQSRNNLNVKSKIPFSP